jgi:IS6 family transposase
MYWHVDETYIRVCGKWRYLWRIVDQKGQFVDFRLTARRDLKAAKAFLKQAQSNCGLYPPATIVTDNENGHPKGGRFILITLLSFCSYFIS